MGQQPVHHRGLAGAQEPRDKQLAPKLARAKGFFETMEQPGKAMLFQLAGGRATLTPAAATPPGMPRVRIVFIAELGRLSAAEIDETMESCTE